MTTSDDVGLIIRLAVEDDLPVLRGMMERAIAELQRPFLDPAAIAASKAVMGLDTQLIADRTYFVAELGGEIAGCGGWSFRATLFGGDHSTDQREPRRLDPASEPARVRAMYTHPDFARRGVGRAILVACEEAARVAGFGQVELMATLAGEPLYRAGGYEPIERTSVQSDGVKVPLIRMGKRLAKGTSHA